MKRYNIMNKPYSVIENPNGAWVKYTDHKAERNELYETIDSNSKKIIKLTKQNREMLEALIEVRSCGKDERMSNEYLDKIIEKVEKENTDG